jgi:putative peptidoglycan lipid II flippase
LILVREPLAAVIFQGGRFTLEDTQRVAFVLLGYAPAVWAYSMMHVFTRAFYARGDAKTPVRVAISVVALNLILNVTLIWTPLREAGLAWSTAICSVVQVISLGVLIRRQTHQLINRAVINSWMRTIIITAIMSGCVLIGLSVMIESTTWSGSLLNLAVFVTAGVVVYVVAAIVLRMPEWRWALGRYS